MYLHLPLLIWYSSEQLVSCVDQRTLPFLISMFLYVVSPVLHEPKPDLIDVSF